MKRFIKPYIMLPLLVLLCVSLWNLVIHSEVRSDFIEEGNLLKNGSFERFVSDKQPDDWTFVSNASAEPSLDKDDGYEGDFSATISRELPEGVVALRSDAVLLERGEYLFKSFYITDSVVSVSVTYTSPATNSSTTEFLKWYPDYDYPWSTLSHNLSLHENMLVSIELQLVGSGYATFDAAYLIKTAADPISKQDLAAEPIALEPWVYGTMDASQNEKDGVYEATVRAYTEGEIKWVFNPIPVKEHEAYQVRLDYTATVPTALYAYTLDSQGKESYHFIGDLPQADQFTTVKKVYEIPAGAAGFYVSATLDSVGIQKIRNVSVTKVAEAATFDMPRISITFDDGWLSSYEEGKPLLDVYGYKSTFYINPASIGEDSFMTDSQVADLIKNGHQIGSHGDTHADISSIAEEEVVSDLADSKKYLSKKNISEVDFASPYGKYDPKSLSVVKTYFSSHRTTEIGINTKQNFDRYQLKGLFVRKDTPQSVIAESIKEAKANNGWLILIYHQIEEDNESRFAITPQAFTDHLALIALEQVRVVTVRQALSEITAQ